MLALESSIYIWSLDRASCTWQLERHFYGFEFSASVCPAGHGYSGVIALSCLKISPCEMHRLEGKADTRELGFCPQGVVVGPKEVMG